MVFVISVKKPKFYFFLISIMALGKPLHPFEPRFIHLWYDGQRRVTSNSNILEACIIHSVLDGYFHILCLF